ncbi:hypothetical protein PAXRUDRAFT_177400 [Paxillus rubicundulus Ve08.2h10]|uniref:CxC2-like cysteine cluster KDZ transposase-associated domain-containing protein n=1 Tax=Paxillus rubicundulus Ve08.2h10 TaxID=930991 RepID=A0A0D0D1Q4_9AGAM|nr:hypothetical protein PAXRUDRAFT_177400 [Paxillus rubicundulus Ve08.2h10]
MVINVRVLECPLKLYKTQNDYLRQWVEHRNKYLEALLAMEASPNLWKCLICDGDAIYRCLGCFSQPLFCTQCCRKQHYMLPFHRIKQWTGTFFEDLSLCLAGMVLHLGHCGQPCPSGVPEGMGQHANRVPFHVDDREWSMEELDDVPPFLWVPQGGNQLTLVDMTSVHLLQVHYCICPTSQQFHMQLLELGLLSATIDQPKTAFSFSVLNDFIHNNLECGTSTSNYYNKLQRITSNVFPHLMPVSASAVCLFMR